MAEPKSFHLTGPLQEYLVAHGQPPDAVQQALIEATREKTGGRAMMQIAPEQGAFMEQLTRLIGARRAIEVGTFTGYSALCIARGLPEDGELICCDVSREWTDIGRPFWEQAGVAKKIDLRIAPAIETLRALPVERAFDIAFIDADKGGYAGYFEELVQRIRPGGVILCDNVLWFGAVVDPANQNDDTKSIRAFNELVAKDARVEPVMLAIGDGLTIARVR